MVTQDLRKICKLAYQRKQLDKENKKPVKDKIEKNLEWKLNINQIQEVKNHKLIPEEIF